MFKDFSLKRRNVDIKRNGSKVKVEKRMLTQCQIKLIDFKELKDEKIEKEEVGKVLFLLQITLPGY